MVDFHVDFLPIGHGPTMLSAAAECRRNAIGDPRERQRRHQHAQCHYEDGNSDAGQRSSNASFRRSWYARVFCRLPQSADAHQRPVPGLERS
jgi:hypothetical protein